jgi:outer membrane protein TolC
VSVPVWEGGSKQAQVDIAKSKVRENQVLLEDAKQQNQAKIENTKYNLIQAKAFLKTKMQQRQYTLHEYEVAVSRLKSGLGNQLDMDEAASGLASATDEKNEAQALYWTARINLAHVMGNIEELMDIQKTGD